MEQQIERIGFDNVSMDFQTANGPLAVVRDMSFSIRQGDFISLVGPSGCGKTTLMNMAAGFLKPTRGTVTLDGKEIEGPGPDRGVMFQEYGVFPWLTVEQNIAFGLELKANSVKVSAAEKREIVERYLNLMGLADFRKAFPKTLSGGMRQRLALARTYAVQPEFVLMDEPFGALDAQTRSAMHDLLLEILHAEGKTVMLITHSVEEAVYLSNKVLVISARPSQIREVVDIPFPYPRNRSLQETPEFNALRSHIHDSVMREYAAQEAQGKPKATA
ncbi:ABC transporter ATP-binding protein [Pollutimonas thiosulfatoxidans]|uniref:ATP-binding protein n=1 Tax=Pollutimonas thiosulfatoxidans TaxID=2028345 RepID=A0A410GEY7_9BURK|nr:ABC transporter ATP-binding protein [Pollutimonas thiosulfatoxidans]NYT45786.1 ABC transporter ATP-binding protein [Alcaligenaceae bacterium]QAA94815.1 ATP-binding protein [Pollutimonas thiosulfatoxidans]